MGLKIAKQIINKINPDMSQLEVGIKYYCLFRTSDNNNVDSCNRSFVPVWCGHCGGAFAVVAASGPLECVASMVGATHPGSEKNRTLNLYVT